MTWRRRAQEECEALIAAGLWRRVRDLDARGPVGMLDGRPVVSFASNDYLGLTAHPAVVDGARAALEQWGAGSGSARLIVGGRPVHGELERELADWKGAEKAVLFPTGFAANLGVLATFGAPGVLICSDELNHASIVDGCRAAHGRVTVYPHGDADAAEALLEDHDGPAIVVTDAVFSMDGDVAPLADLARVCRARDALLVLDEAHSVLGSDPDLDGVEALRVGTLSKFLGAMGGFVAGPATMIDLLVNRARTFIFTTASSPADAGAALAALRLYRAPEGAALRQRLRSFIDRIAPGHPSPIIPIVLGDERAALDAADALLDRGLLVPAIRPPSVPPGSARLRVTLSAAHTEEHLDRLQAALDEVVGVHT